MARLQQDCVAFYNLILIHFLLPSNHHCQHSLPTRALVTPLHRLQLLSLPSIALANSASFPPPPSSILVALQWYCLCLTASSSVPPKAGPLPLRPYILTTFYLSPIITQPQNGKPSMLTWVQWCPPSRPGLSAVVAIDGEFPHNFSLGCQYNNQWSYD